MTRRSPAPDATTATKIRFVGPADQYLPGLAQGELAIGSDVSLERAHEAVASKLYEPVDGALAPLPANETATAAAAPEEV
jgi:hypothetical protein